MWVLLYTRFFLSCFVWIALGCCKEVCYIFCREGEIFSARDETSYMCETTSIFPGKYYATPSLPSFCILDSKNTPYGITIGCTTCGILPITMHAQDVRKCCDTLGNTEGNSLKLDVKIMTECACAIAQICSDVKSRNQVALIASLVSSPRCYWLKRSPF